MNTLEVARTWHDLGIATIPILARSKSPALDSWAEYQTRLPTMYELTAWFAESGYNLAVVTGWQGLVIVDFDDMGTFNLWLAELTQDNATRVLTTYRVSTARGMHLYFYVDEPTRAGKLPNVDIKAAGGYALSPPSIHPSGALYVGTDHPRNIKHVPSIEVLLPGYTRAMTEFPQSPFGAGRTDPFDAAMMPEVPSGAIEAIKARLSIADVLGQSNGSHRRTWLTTCPLHGDKQPSFAVYADGHFHCFGCGAHGDVIDLWAMMHHVTTREAIAALAGGATCA
jgi:hypothetical protein